MAGGGTQDWAARAADQVLAAAIPGKQLTVASGISPSGPIHLGNLREVMVPHAVAEELRSRGHDCRHLLSWDDYDRLRKVPAGLPAGFAEYIGRPLTAVPDPCGEHASWAEHFQTPFRAALADLGVAVTETSQSIRYAEGAYAGPTLLAMRRRAEIDAILARYRTLHRTGEPDEDYYPFKPYCPACGRDTTSVTAFDDESTHLAFDCACGHTGAGLLAEVAGKLVWKVDWPMRWAYEGVDFEAAGADHSSPGSSFTVGSQVVAEVFGGRPPAYLAYSFVGTSGSAKMSGSAGGAPTPADALEIMEPQLLRWLYGRRRPNQAITVAFDAEIGRLYDEWDALTRRVRAGSADEVELAAYTRASATSARTLPTTPVTVPFRTLASIVDVTTGDPAQLRRVLADLAPGDLADFRPRLDRAAAWVTTQVPAAERTRVRGGPDTELLASLGDADRHALKLLADGLAASWSLDGLTALVYGVPKLQLGLPLDTAPTPELKAAQRAFFVLVYRLLVGRDTGPRLPTLLLAVGADRVRTLLSS
ncbi:lysyl-tRNA synthetase class 1 [Allocatelliglobosispora scoriae]|uniref:Lysine--tRNA ligase n=1 Tax=Allocatelliglobosispora scoriae TaxID=643052 RepID=A0A841BK79_9ACTN|nr:lysine--tRNA ligase [Allocatelliglobosispora scoriae]MBB5867172.1 lysyl-tRNA synthetase class 1 [Allocatelliglobosispora scoriae]